MKISIYDTTLRDGSQGAGVSYTEEDKLRIIRALDGLGADYIEAGNPSSNIKDAELLERACKMRLKNAKLAAFVSTRRPGTDVYEDEAIVRTASLEAPVVTVVGKSWLYQVSHVLKATAEENLAMIRDTVSYFKAAGKEVVFDAEHFFDGYGDNPQYALDTVGAAAEAGADTVVLCDTNGGSLPDVIGMVTAAVKSRYPEPKLGIHCHNDLGMAVAASLEAVLSGAEQVQGTVSGVGERCGNANLNTLIPLLQLKMGYGCIPEESMRGLTRSVRYINEIMNLPFNDSEPFVGGYAFSHKAGMHIDAVRKSPRSFEHIMPELVGNERNLLVSELSGRAAVIEKTASLKPGLTKDSEEVKRALELIKERESRGYQYENAEASLMLLIREALGIRRKFYEILNFQVSINESPSGSLCTALIKIEVDGKTGITAAEGDGPVNALDLAMRESLVPFYPTMKEMRLSDYKVRVLNSTDTTASKVRVFIETTDGVRVWNTIGVSNDIIEASRQALADAIETKLIMEYGETKKEV